MPILGKVGFYLDDWATLCQLNFGPREQGLWALMYNYGCNNSLVIIRPIEALHFSLAFWNFGLNPLPWHILNVVFEIAVALLTCAIIRRLTRSVAVGFFAAVFVLLCPTHDSSHYWVVCSSVTLSFALYLASLLANIAALSSRSNSGKIVWYSLSALLFLLSLFNYEIFMPLAAVNIVVALYFGARGRLAGLEGPSKLTALKSLVLSSLLTIATMVLPVVSLVFYLKLIVPSISSSSMRAIHFDIFVFLNTVLKGIELNTPISFCHFVFARAQEGLDGLSRSGYIAIFAITAITVAAVGWLRQCEALKAADIDAKPPVTIAGVPLIALGLFTVVVSYTIFGLCPDYPPTYMTLFNRINTGASFGLVLLFSGVFSLPLSKYRWLLAIQQYSLVVSSAVFAMVFTLADVGLSKPWIASWVTQKHIQRKLTEEFQGLPKDASLLLLNCPRYVMWAPVYDGVWDFQNTVRIFLGRKDVNAGVVSERLVLSKDGVKDISRGTECGAYPFRSLYLLAAPDCSSLHADTPEKFVKFVERDGMGFGLQQQAVNGWKLEAARLAR